MTATIQVRLPDGDWRDLQHILQVEPDGIRVVFLPEHNRPPVQGGPFDGTYPLAGDRGPAGTKMPAPPGQGGQS